jgi:hypothetical protein
MPRKWFAVSPGRIFDPFGVASKAEKNRHSAIHLIHQFLLGQVTHFLNQLVDFCSRILIHALLNIKDRWRRISHGLDVDDVEVSFSRNQLGGTSVTE